MVGLVNSALRTRSVLACGAFFLSALVLAGCTSTPAPVVVPSSDVPSAQESAAQESAAQESPIQPSGGRVSDGQVKHTSPAASDPAGSPDGQPTTNQQDSGWTSTIVQGSPTPSAVPSAAPDTPNTQASPAARTPRTDLPNRFDSKADRLVKDACSAPKGVLADGWWVVMIGARAPESKAREDWKHFGLLVDPVCFKAGPPPSITNPGGELNWLRLADDVQFSCAEGLKPCAVGVFRRPLPAYPPSKIPLGERNWPVVAIRMNAGQIDRVEEIVMPGDQPRALTPGLDQSGLPGAPVATTGGQPPGTLGAGG